MGSIVFVLKQNNNDKTDENDKKGYKLSTVARLNPKIATLAHHKTSLLTP